ncbi:hypothetical protein CYMTET_36552, partial [Cymbomonas tetramitiformis]
LNGGSAGCAAERRGDRHMAWLRPVKAVSQRRGGTRRKGPRRGSRWRSASAERGAGTDAAHGGLGGQGALWRRWDRRRPTEALGPMEALGGGKAAFAKLGGDSCDGLRRPTEAPRTRARRAARDRRSSPRGSAGKAYFVA